MKIKDETVSLMGIRPELILGIMICKQVLDNHAIEMVFTSGTEAQTKHGATSLHYTGQAVDFRSQHIDDAATKSLVFHEMKEALQVDYDLLLEGENQSWEHFHLEYQPKRRDFLVNR